MEEQNRKNHFDFSNNKGYKSFDQNPDTSVRIAALIRIGTTLTATNETLQSINAALQNMNDTLQNINDNIRYQ